MTTRRLLLLLVVAMGITVTVVQTRRGATDGLARTFQVTGTVTAPMAERRVMVAHGDIPGYMPAMTMPFAVAADETPSLAAGDRVRFTLQGDCRRIAGRRIRGHWARRRAGRRAEGGNQAGAEAAKKGDEIPAFSLTTSEGRA